MKIKLNKEQGMKVYNKGIANLHTTVIKEAYDDANNNEIQA
jgi:hypothetical protein